jgi:hypothetical protein
MKFRSKLLIIIVTCGILSYSSCKKPEQYPLIPAIEYVSFAKIQNTLGVDNKGILTFSFTDGDGDIGLAAGDTLAPFNPGSQYYYDLFVTYYEKQHGDYIPVVLPMTNNLRIPVITPTSGNKSIKGTIDVELFINNPASTYDTIAYDVSIVDRALNLSNKIRTPDIIIHK